MLASGNYLWISGIIIVLLFLSKTGITFDNILRLMITHLSLLQAVPMKNCIVGLGDGQKSSVNGTTIKQIC